MKFRCFWRTWFLWQNEIVLLGKKRTALFQTYNWEKSSFSTRSYMYLQRYVQIHGRGAHICPPLGLIGSIDHSIMQLYHSLISSPDSKLWDSASYIKVKSASNENIAIVKRRATVEHVWCLVEEKRLICWTSKLPMKMIFVRFVDQSQ